MIGVDRCDWPAETDTSKSLFGGFPELTRLDVSSTAFDVATSGIVDRCTKLKRLVLRACNIDDAGVAVLSALPALTNLNLSCNNNLTDNIVDSLMKFPRLQHLDVSNTKLSLRALHKLIFLPRILSIKTDNSTGTPTNDAVKLFQKQLADEVAAREKGREAGS